MQLWGCRDAEEVEVEGTKTRAERNEKGSPHPPQPQASSHPLLNKEVSAICDQFLLLFSERRVSPCQDSTLLLGTIEITLYKSCLLVMVGMR